MSNKTAEKRMDRAKTALTIRYPFFGVLSSTTQFIEDTTGIIPCKTMGTDSKRIWYHADFLEKITDANILAVIVHELYHIINLHCDKNRVRGRDHNLWSIANDLVVNLEIIDDVGLHLPLHDKNGNQVALYDKQFVGMTSEQVYDKIKKDKKYIDMAANGKTFDVHILCTIDEDEVIERILVAYEAAKSSGQGNIPAGIERLVKDIRRTKVKWERMLHRYIGSVIEKNDYSFSHPNRRYLVDDLYLPSLRNPIIGNIYFAVDTSGSMGEEDLSQILSEMIKLNGLVDKITVVSCDAAVHEIVPVYKMESIADKVIFSGGGGTDFKPVFDLIEESNEQPELLIYATDTYGFFPEKAPNYPVLWVSTVSKDRANDFPFGHAIYMD